VVEEGVHLLRLVGVDHQSGPLVRQQEVLVLVEDVQPGLEEGEEEVVLPGLVKKLVVDVQAQHVPLRQPLVPLAALAVALHPFDADILLHEGRRQQGQGLGQKAVQPLARVVFPDGELSHGVPPGWLFFYCTRIFPVWQSPPGAFWGKSAPRPPAADPPPARDKTSIFPPV
jgi:hypothetical protein